NKDYVFMFKNNSLIVMSLNLLTDVYYISKNTTKQKTLSFFIAHKTFKYCNGIRRKQYVHNDIGYLEYYYANNNIFNATDSNLNNEIKAVMGI
ncbi:MAG: hypothetical protein AABY22_27740, partial [Nanoarchaeota archaeon]